MAQIVINKCYGGFGLSDAAEEALIGKCEHTTLVEPIEYYGGPGSAYYEANKDRKSPDEWRQSYERDLERSKTGSGLLITRFHDGKVICDDHRNESNRSCPELIKVVEALGEKESSGQLAELRIVEIPDGVNWELSEYDGIESVHEVHRTWG